MQKPRQREDITTMNAKNGIKVARSMLYVCTGAITAGTLLAPATALANNQWNPKTMLQNAGQSAGVHVNEINTSTVTGWVNTVVSWAIGIVVAIFVLRIALTAFDRMVLANNNSTAHIPFAYPNPGDERYDPNDIRGNTPPEGWTWKRIWINFAKNIAIVAGAWLLVQIVMQIVLMVMNQAVSTATG